jgi:TolB-like protein
MSLMDELKRRNVFRVGVAYTIIGWVVAQVAEFAFENFGAPEWVLKVVVVLLLLGLPIALIFAWAFEMTPDGVKLEKDVDRSASITPETGKKLNALTIAALAAAVILLGADRFMQSDERDATPQTIAEESAGLAATDLPDVGDQSIAVLPFVAMTASEDDEFFADGLSEELLNVLAKIEGLKVAGRTSSFYYKGRNEDLRDIAAALGVANILEGSVRRSGSQIRVTAQLIKAADGFHLWSETYDRADGDIFAIQDSIAIDVAGALQATIMGEITKTASTATRNVEAQNYYLIAQAAIAERGLLNVRRARDLYAKASELDKENPKYLAGYATAVALQFWNYRDITPDEAIYEASTAIDVALSLEEPNADTLAVAALVEELRAATASDPAAKGRALTLYKKALAMEPNNILALQWLASIYLDIGNGALARENFEKVLELDPLNILSLTGLANAYLYLGQHDESRLHLYKMQTLFPDLGMIYRYLSGVEYLVGRLDLSTLWGIKSMEIDPNPIEIYSLVVAYKAFGWVDEALETAEQFNEVSAGGADISILVQSWLDNDFEGLANESTRIFAETGGNVFASLAAWSNAKSGNYPTAINTLERQHPSLRGEVLDYLDTEDMMDAVLLAYCYDKVGNSSASVRVSDMLLASELLSEEMVANLPIRRMVRIGALAVNGQVERAIDELRNLDSNTMPIALGRLALPIDELPVFESLYESDVFRKFATDERYRLAQQAKMLASGETEKEMIASVEAAGYTITR